MDKEDAQAAVRSFVARAVGEPRSTEAIALRLGLTSAAIGHWKTGASHPHAWQIFKVAADFDLSIDEWLLPPRERESLAARIEALEAEVFQGVVAEQRAPNEEKTEDGR